MKVIKDKDINKIINAKNSQEVQKILKTSKNENAFEKTLETLRKLIYNYNEKYLEVIDILLQSLYEEATNTEDNYFEKCNKAITFRKAVPNIFQSISKRCKKRNEDYSYLKNFEAFLETIDRKFDESIETSRINIKNNEEGFSQIINYLDMLVKNMNYDNMDIVKRLLSYLENQSDKNNENIINKCEKISEIKDKLSLKLSKQEECDGKHENYVSNLKYTYQKLEKIELSIAMHIKESTDEFEKEGNFDELIKYLEKITDNFTERYADIVYKILASLEREIIKDDGVDYLTKCEKLLNIRKKIVEVIKSTEKMTRKLNNKFYYLKDFANQLENLELNLSYNIKSPEVLTNYSIVKHIIFDKKDSDYTANLIHQNPYLINAFNLNNENILNQIVKEYVKTINDHGSKSLYTNLCYYDKCLELILSSRYIRTEEETKEKCIDYITKEYKKILSSGKSNDFSSNWYKHIKDKIENPYLVEDINRLNNMYNIKKELRINTPNINIPKKRTTRTNDYIVTIDEDYRVHKDDAISIRKSNDLYDLKIYISDPNTLLGNNSIEIKNAINHGETIYLENNKIDMFPTNIVENYLSLEQNETRGVRVYRFLIDKYGEVVNFKITKEPIKISKNYTYDEFDELLKMSTSTEEENLIENLNALKIILNRDCIDNQVLENFHVDATTSKKLVSLFMIYTNHKVAEYFAKNDLPFIYRHYSSEVKPIDKDFIENIKPNEIEKYINYLEEIGEIIPTATYSLDHTNHDALDLGYYSNVTSPIRRSADLIANECMDASYFDTLSDKERIQFYKHLSNRLYLLNDRLKANSKYYEECSKYVLQRK